MRLTGFTMQGAPIHPSLVWPWKGPLAQLDGSCWTSADVSRFLISLLWDRISPGLEGRLAGDPFSRVFGRKPDRCKLSFDIPMDVL